MFAMKRLVALVDRRVDREDFFNTTNKPKLLPSRAIMKITAYAVVIPILIFSGILSRNGADVGTIMCVAAWERNQKYL